MEAAFAPRRDDICRHRPRRCPTASAAYRPSPSQTPSIQLSFRVDEPIVGVERGQVLTIHEWAGAWSMHRPMSKGEHILIFLYPPSRLGLTSPVGGSLGQIALDPSGVGGAISVTQLERAIRRAREE